MPDECDQTNLQTAATWTVRLCPIHELIASEHNTCPWPNEVSNQACDLELSEPFLVRHVIQAQSKYELPAWITRRIVQAYATAYAINSRAAGQAFNRGMSYAMFRKHPPEVEELQFELSDVLRRLSVYDPKRLPVSNFGPKSLQILQGLYGQLTS